MNLAEILNGTGDAAARLVKTANADTQATVRFLLSKIREKDHRALLRFLENENAVDLIREPYEEYREMDLQGLAALAQTAGRDLTLAALVAIVVIVQSVAAGEPLRLSFSKQIAVPEGRWHGVENDDDDWIGRQFSGLTDEKVVISVSVWAEQKRYLPPQVTRMPGYYRYSVAPFLREIADCMSIESPVREFDFMKGVQIGATVGILENALGYVIDHVKSAPVMLLTADAELAKLRVDSYVIPMLQSSGLEHLVQSSDVGNVRKTGKTSKKLEWAGGGFMVPFGAQNADKLRSISIMYLLEDEIDTYPERVGKDGDPQKLAEDRTNSYHEVRKIARVSTPLLKGSSRIARGFEKGDQRRYFVPCKKCKEMQVLTFQGGRASADETPYGLVWETDDDGDLIETSVRYVCKYCGHPHRNSDKAWMLPRGEWRATAKARNAWHRSYHISALYSPVGMYPWSAVVADWLDAWDEEAKTVRDTELLQTFYNNNLGEPFEIRGAKVRFEMVSAHRRAGYRLGQIPNEYARKFSGSGILFLTCQVDVHKRNLAVSVMGWTRDARVYLIDYWRFETTGEDDAADEVSSSVWGRLRSLLEEAVYTADDGKRYNIILTGIDASYATDTVTHFCGQYAGGVVPLLGRERPAKHQTIKEFAQFKAQDGTVGYRVLVDHYKDRMAPVLRREWSEEAGAQKPYHFNAPVDITDKQLKELTTETRREKIDDNGNTSYYWHRPGNVPNELWDLLGYGYALVDIVAWSICIEHFEMETIDWLTFWDYLESESLYYSTP